MNCHDTFIVEDNSSRRSIWKASAIAVAGLAAAALTLTAASAPAATPLKKADTSKWAARYLVTTPAAAAKAAALRAGHFAFKATSAGATVPYWSTTVTSPLDHVTYNVSMVGGNPFVANPGNTNVTYVPIVVRIHFPGGFVFDPTQPANCDNQAVSRRFFNSPIFRPTQFTSNGINVSQGIAGSQLESAFQRANFWGAVHGTAYGVTLIPSRLDPIVVDYTANAPGDEVVGVYNQCGPGINPFGLMSIDEYDALVQGLTATYATSTQIPVVLAYNVVLFIGTPGNCCVIGYHNAYSVTGGTQLYAVGTYVDPGIFSGLSDIGAWSHELGELIDDPFVQSIPGVPGGYNNDLTPAWGNIGQVNGCQNNLEVGDPLTGSQYAITGVGGFVYHYQDLADISWFYRTASQSTGGKGSFKGLLPGSGQPTVCH